MSEVLNFVQKGERSLSEVAYRIWLRAMLLAVFEKATVKSDSKKWRIKVMKNIPRRNFGKS